MVSAWGSLARVPMCCHLPRALSKPGRTGRVRGQPQRRRHRRVHPRLVQVLEPGEPGPGRDHRGHGDPGDPGSRCGAWSGRHRRVAALPGGLAVRGQLAGEARCRPAGRRPPYRPGRGAGRSGCARDRTSPWAIRRAHGPTGIRRAGVRPAASGEPAGPRVGWAPLPGRSGDSGPSPGRGPDGRRCRPPGLAGAAAGRSCAAGRSRLRAGHALRRQTGPVPAPRTRCGPASPGNPGSPGNPEPPGNAEPSGYPGPSVDGQGGWRRVSAARRVRPAP